MTQDEHRFLSEKLAEARAKIGELEKENKRLHRIVHEDRPMDENPFDHYDPTGFLESVKP